MLKNQVRIIGGKWRGRKISFTDAVDLRPTPDRVRETLFNWLATELPDARCLDLFAGTGVLGLECLSRGAREIVFLEKDTKVYQTLQGELAKLIPKQESAETSHVHLIHTDTLTWLTDPKNQTQYGTFDIIFADPPYSSNLLETVFSVLENGAWISENGYIYFESNHPVEPSIIPKTWEIIKEKKAGQVYYYLARKT